ncbi:MAG: ATP-binding cassette domain-containing protein [Roseivivax sp.]|nr:ATP-binding cassette domain-containing protein [Roseivivax sp.]
MSGQDNPRGLLIWLWRRYLRPHTGMLALSVVLMSLEGAMFGALSYMMKPMFDKVFVGGQTGALAWVAALIFVIFVIRALASVGQKVLLAKVSQRTLAAMRTGLLEHLMTLDGTFHQMNPPGYLIQRIDGDTEAISKVWRTVITGAGRDVVALISLFAVAIGVDWRWTLIALLGAPLLVLPATIVQRKVRLNARRAREIAARQSTRLDEVFHGILPIKLNRNEAYQSRRYQDLTQSRIQTEVQTTTGEALVPGMIDILAGAGLMGVLFYGGAEIIDGQKTVGEFMAFFTAIGLAFEPLRRLGAISGVWQTAAAGIERIRALLSLTPELRDPAVPIPAPVGVPEVRLEAAVVRYGDLTVLDGASFVAEAGKTTALVGASGAGKSTVFNLLTRLVDPASGAAVIGGVDTRAMRLADLRALFSVVSQEALLFDETVRENILLGRSDVAEAELTRALDAAYVSDFLPRLPNGLDSPAGPRGSALSGGQRQRVAIARALLRDAPILLLDEATSALDAQSERMVQEALDGLSRGRTTLVIAHRLSTVRNADKIVVMDRGRVVEEGTHESLLSQGGAYAALYQLQFQEDAE